MHVHPNSTSCCVTQSTLLNLSEPQLSHLRTGNGSSDCLPVLRIAENTWSLWSLVCVWRGLYMRQWDRLSQLQEHRAVSQDMRIHDLGWAPGSRACFFSFMRRLTTENWGHIPTPPAAGASPSNTRWSLRRNSQRMWERESDRSLGASETGGKEKPGTDFTEVAQRHKEGLGELVTCDREPSDSGRFLT